MYNATQFANLMRNYPFLNCINARCSRNHISFDGEFKKSVARFHVVDAHYIPRVFVACFGFVPNLA